MKAMLADPSTPKSPLATDIGFLVNLYDQLQERGKPRVA